MPLPRRDSVVDISTTIAVEVICSNCNAKLHAEYNNIRDEVNVDLCDSCLKNKYDEGFAEGWDEAGS